MATTSRRNLLKVAGLMGAGYTLHLFGSSAEVSSSPSTQKLPWLYSPLDPQATAERAYLAYPNHGCMYAVCSSIVGQLAEKHGEPYQSFPIEALSYGHGGVGGYGTLCGALNGAALVFGLFFKQKGHADPFIANLFNWYEHQALPIFVPAQPTLNTDIVQVPAESVLCHASVSRWCMKAQAGPEDPERTERCRRLSADVAAKAVSTLNDYASGKALPSFALDEGTAECLSCHGLKEAKMYQATTKMHCGSCHTSPHNGTLENLK